MNVFFQIENGRSQKIGFLLNWTWRFHIRSCQVLQPFFNECILGLTFSWFCSLCVIYTTVKWIDIRAKKILGNAKTKHFIQRGRDRDNSLEMQRMRYSVLGKSDRVWFHGKEKERKGRMIKRFNLWQLQFLPTSLRARCKSIAISLIDTDGLTRFNIPAKMTR